MRKCLLRLNTFFVLSSAMWLASARPGFSADCSKGAFQNVNQYVLAAWAMIPPGAKGAQVEEIEKYMDKVCLENECPIFCSNEKSKVSKELLELQKKCRDKDASSCDRLFAALGMEKSPDAIEKCFLLGGRACDLCDQIGGAFCQKEVRFGEPIHDTGTALFHKIACSGGYQEACDGFKVFEEKQAQRLQEQCTYQKDKISCAQLVSDHVKKSRTEDAIRLVMEFCISGPVDSCLDLFNAGLNAADDSAREGFKAAVEKRIDAECTRNKSRIACCAKADLIRESQPKESVGIMRDLCLTASGAITSLEHHVCWVTFEESVKSKKWPDAEKAADVLCKYYLGVAPNRNPALCDATRNELNSARGGKAIPGKSPAQDQSHSKMPVKRRPSKKNGPKPGARRP